MGSKAARAICRGGRYITRCHDMLKSDAYRDLSLTARCLLEEFQIAYNGSNNGSLSISTKNASRLLKVSEPTAIKAFRELVEHGFIKLTEHHYWQQQRAREFRLTFEKHNGREASNEWLLWSEDCPVAELKKCATQK